jgi:hypothetical protein
VPGLNADNHVAIGLGAAVQRGIVASFVDEVDVLHPSFPVVSCLKLSQWASRNLASGDGFFRHVQVFNDVSVAYWFFRHRTETVSCDIGPCSSECIRESHLAMSPHSSNLQVVERVRHSHRAQNQRHI